MIPRFLIRAAALPAILFISLTFAFAQDAASTTTNGVAAFVRDADVEAGLVRPRVAKSAKAVSEFAGAMTSDKIASFERRVLAMINKKRAEFGLAPVSWNDDAARIAKLHSGNMARYGFFSHRGQDGKMVDERADQLGVSKWNAIGENIAYNRGYDDPLATAVEKWLESPSHRNNILDPRWRDSGIGISVTDDGTFYFTQVFILRR